MVTDKSYAPTFVYNCLTAGVGAIVDKETVMANVVGEDMGGEWLKSNSAGTGAYVLKSYKPNESYVLEAREDYWRGAPKLSACSCAMSPKPRPSVCCWKKAISTWRAKCPRWIFRAFAAMPT